MSESLFPWGGWVLANREKEGFAGSYHSVFYPVTAALLWNYQTLCR